jgi:hypothetical protein
MKPAALETRWSPRLPLLYAAALFSSAALLFLVQPLTARLVLPLLGGSPAVWNTCMLVFQMLLLAGYLYAHAAPHWLGERRQALVHLAVLALPWLVLPIALRPGWSPPVAGSPVVWLAGVLLVAVGLPFFAVATTGPLLQRWFAATGHPAGRDPYFLYAASNLGSLLGLFAYPFLLEPLLRLGEQAWTWSAGYALFLLQASVSAAALWRSPGSHSLAATESTLRRPLAWRHRGRWLLLAFVPSSLLLSVTLHLTMDVAPIPLLWVVPLALYLLSFVLAFARRPWLSAKALGRNMPVFVLLVVLAMLSEATQPAMLLLPLHMALLFWVALFCHTSLAEERPPAAQLTEFYLWLSIGGALGGAFNALLAPLLFRGLAEYPIVLVLACTLRPPEGKPARPGRIDPRWLDVLLPLGLAGLAALLVLAVHAAGVPPGPLRRGLLFLLPVVVCYTFLSRPFRFAFGIAVLLAVGALHEGTHGSIVYRERSFFGVHRVTLDPTRSFHILVHGNTEHGRQNLDPQFRHEPLTYYYRDSPIGKLIAALDAAGQLHRVGVVGLGAGALCCYAHTGQEWTFYEIDPAVIHIACDSGLFTFWKDCAVRPMLVPGDARLTLQQSHERYDLLVIDAFSSDAIPLHLLTREALAIYQAHLSDHGVLAFHISNDYLDLAPILGDLAGDAQPPLVCRRRDDRYLLDAERRMGASPSQWVAQVRDEEDRFLFLDTEGRIAPIHGWLPVQPRLGRRVWSDDYSNILGALKWE